MRAVEGGPAAREARSLGRAVYAVPGPLGVRASAGVNALIASGAAAALLGPESLGLAAGRGCPAHRAAAARRRDRRAP